MNNHSHFIAVLMSVKTAIFVQLINFIMLTYANEVFGTLTSIGCCAYIWFKARNEYKNKQ